LIDRAISRHWLAQKQVTTETKFGKKVAWGEDDARMPNTRIAQKKCTVSHWTMKNMASFTLDNENEDVRYRRQRQIERPF